jgi:hypothetical protein
MTDQQLAALEAKLETDHRAEQAERMALAMQAVAQVSTQRYRTSMTYGIVRK